MEIKTAKRRKQDDILLDSRFYLTDNDSPPLNDPAFNLRLSLYQIPPTLGDITIEEFESFALARLRVLQEIEHAAGKREARLDYIQSILKKYLPLDIRARNEDEAEELQRRAIRKDVISHFALRLAYRKPADRQWFITQERRLLEYDSYFSFHQEARLLLDRRYDPNAIANFLRANNIPFEKPKPSEFAEAKPYILRVWRSVQLVPNAIFDDNSERWYKVPFEKALELVEQRKVYLYMGMAFVHEDDYISIILHQFKDSLTEALVRTFKAFPLNCDERVDSIINTLPKQYIGRDYSTASLGASSGRSRHVGLNEIDALARRSFPLCMKFLHTQLRRNHHIKHMGRLQYGLFLKGIGVTLEDAIEFWKRELVQKYGEDGWRKKGYEYNILHSYGQLGKRANYTPYACQKIISSQVLPGDDHGCPFRHRDGATLGVLLREAGLDDQQCREVIALAREEKYMDACKRYFEYTHPGAQDDFIMNHPNKYFEQSMRYYRGLGGAAKSGQNSTE